MIGIQLKRNGRLFLTQILADQATADQRFGSLKGILLLIADGLNVDGRKSLFFASALNKLKRKGELAGRINLVQEGSLGILFLAADITSMVNGILKTCGIKRQIEIQGAVAHIDLRNLRVLVVIAVDGPSDAILRALVTEQCILDFTVVFFHVGACLDQLCLKTLTIMCYDITACLLVKADDTLIAGEKLAFIIVIAFLEGSFVCGILCIELIVLVCLGLVCFLILFSLCKGGRGFIHRFDSGMLNRHLMLHTQLCAKLHQLRDRLENFLGSGTVFLFCLGGTCCRNSIRCCGGGLLDDLLVGLLDQFFDHRHLTCGISRAVHGNTTLRQGLRGCISCLGTRNQIGRHRLSLSGLCDHGLILGMYLFCTLLNCDFRLCNDLFFKLTLSFFGLIFFSIVDKDILLCLCKGICGIVCFHDFLGSVLLTLCGLCDSESIPLGIKHSQKYHKNKRAYSHGNCQSIHSSMRNGRNGAKQKRHYHITTTACVLLVFCDRIIRFLQTLLSACLHHLADENANSCYFCAKQTRQHDCRDKKYAFHVPIDDGCRS